MARSEYEKVGQADDGLPSLATDDEGSEGDQEQLRTSGEVRRHDQETLTAEEEAERLLTGEKGGRKSGRRDGRHSERRRKGKKASRAEGERELMYEMEEGGPRSSSAESSGNSSEVDLARLGDTHARQKTRGSRFCKFAAVHVVIVFAFLALLYGAYRATGGHGAATPADPVDSNKESETSYKPQTLSNGTHDFLPTTILISLDGFRADFLFRNLTPTLSSFVRSGVSPKYMLPSFPSLTFPNHFTLVTGLYPESHGIVGNTFWDPSTQKEFYYTDPNRSMQAEWWNAEPVWETAELAGVRAAIHMWPGSEAGIGMKQPEFVDQYNGREELDNKVSRVLGWLDLPGPGDEGASLSAAIRPQLIAAYVPNVDVDGHAFGPNSTYIRSTIAEVDGMLGVLFKGIDDRNLSSVVNIVIVSDHGMATTSVDRLIQLEDLIDTGLIEHTDGWPLYGLRPYNQSEAMLQKLRNTLLDKSRLPQYRGTFEVHLRDEDMPERYHFTDNPRIAPLWIVPTAGWAIVTKDEFDVAAGKEQGLTYSPMGLHGYDHENPLMRAIFIARGPAFPHAAGSELEPFQNIDVYNIICDSLGVEPVPNNGTLRLPLTPSGLHDFEQPGDVPKDPQDDMDLALPPDVPNLANRPDFMVPTEGVPPVPPTPTSTPTPPAQPSPPVQPARPIVHDGLDDDDKDGDVNMWWEWVNGKLDAIKGWATGLFGAKEGASDSTSNGR